MAHKLRSVASLKDLVIAQAGGKAIGPSPALMDPGRPVGVVDLNLGRLPGRAPNDGGAGNTRIRQKNAARHMGVYGGSEAVDWLMSGIRFTAETVANAEFHFEKPTGPQIKRTPGEAVAPPEALWKLLKEPNPYMEYMEMMELLVIDLLIVGNSYWLKWRTNDAGQPLALYRLAPPYVEVETTPWGPGGYVYQIPNAEKLEIDPSMVIHFKLPNPDAANPFFGVGLIAGAGRAADLEIGLTGSMASYYENHALPSLALESLRRIPRDVFRKVRAQMRARMQGPKNTGELLVLEAGLKMAPLAPTAADAAFLQISKMSRDRVLSWLRLNPKLLGIQDENTSETVSEAQRHFDNKTVKPLLNKLAAKWTTELTSLWALDYIFDYEYQLDPKEQAAIAQAFAVLPGIKVDEVRKIAGLGPHDEEEVGEMTINLPGEDGEIGAEHQGIPDNNLGGEGGRPPNPGNTRAFPKEGQKAAKGSTTRKPRLRGASKRKEEGKAIEDIVGRLDELVAEHKALGEKPATQDLLKGRREFEVDAHVSEFQSELKRAARVLERGLLDTAEGKALPEGKAVDLSNILSQLKSSDAWGAFEPLAREAYEKALTKVMSAAAIHHGDVGLKPTRSIDYEKVMERLINKSDTGIKAITATFKDELVDRVKDAKTTGDMQEVLNAIQDGIANWVVKKVPMIAITEATRGYNESTLEVADAAGIEQVYVSDGTEDDAPCIEANGQIWDLDKARAHPMEHPRCRRAFVPLPAT